MANARHSKAACFVQQRLFAGLSAFVELERRIAYLPDEKSRGDAFEVFTEAYLATQRKHDAETIWPLPSVPTEILRNLQLAMQDYGVDGVLKTRLAKFSAYQVKFRTGRPALTWRELSTFMGLADSPNIHSRILLTNCDELPSVLNDRQGFFCIRGSDLDRLEPDDFKTIEAWLADSAYQAPKKTPQLHQAEALDVILPAFKDFDRVSAIMACGTGKTLLALWVAEHVARAAAPASSGGVSAATILVLVPSLALLRQMLHEWLRETNLPALAYLCVCSDPTVKEGLDTIDTKQSDLDFQVSTDAASVREFLDAPFDGPKIVFSTYQSAQVVGAALKAGEAFDLAVFDEAHKTAGREGRNYAFALEDAKLPIRKRLFLTATPRHYNPHDRDREGEAKLLFSMDNPEVYGPQAYRLTFAEAARRGIICGYKVIISVITSEMVTNELLSRGEVVVNGDAVRARQVANQIALCDAIEKCESSKVFTFHSTVKSAASFVADGSEGIGTHLNGDGRAVLLRRPDQEKWAAQQRGPTDDVFQTFHVNGMMPTARREREMCNFRAAARAVMSNARCLTEGVDVPAVDMVAFLSPRRSRVDIVQATGRAMRRSPGKRRGYVLVPLYVELATGETVEAAVNRAEFDEVWDVLNSLQEQDDVLAEIIRAMREQRGRTKGFDDAKFRKRVEIRGSSFSLEAIRNAITTACIERLGNTWDERFGELNAFKERVGHCNVPRGYQKNTELGIWVGSQREYFRKGIISKARIRQLDAIGFDWDPHESFWQRMYAELKSFQKREAHCNVPSRYRPNPLLRVWIGNQRQFFRKAKLSSEKIRKLDALGFDWNPYENAWQQMFESLKKFKKTTGHCDVPARYRSNLKLGAWVDQQRQMLRRGKLSEHKVRKLDALGFEWDPYSGYWKRMFEELEAFREREGHCNVPAKHRLNPALGTWVDNQRQRADQLSKEQMRKLKALGFDWTPYRNRWQRMFEELEAFKTKYGHCNVPQGSRDSLRLGAWAARQRSLVRKGRLPRAEKRKLDSIGFEWDPDESFWKRMFEQLKAFKKQYGHCTMPQKHPQNQQLASWVNNHRSRKSKLSSERVRQLNSLGFEWERRSSREPAKKISALRSKILP